MRDNIGLMFSQFLLLYIVNSNRCTNLKFIMKLGYLYDDSQKKSYLYDKAKEKI